MIHTWATSRSTRVLSGLVVAALMVIAGPGVASAHTDFESSTPADGAVVEGPLTEVVVSFTNPAVPAGDGFELLDPTGQVRAPSSIDETDGTSFVLSFDPALTAGTHGLRWRVQAGDAHPIEGSFRFEVTEPVVTTTQEPVDATVSTPTTTARAPSSTTVVTPVDTAPQPSASASSSTTVVPPADAESSQPDETAAASPTLDEFLETGGADGDAAAIGRVGRMLTFLGTIFGLGAVAALVWVVRGRREELVRQLAWIRLAGIVIAAGGVVELVALQSAQSDGLSDLLGTKAGVAAAFKIAGGAAVWLGFHPRAGRFIAPAHSLSAAVAPEIAAPTSVNQERNTPSAGYRWSPAASAGLGLAGYALVLVSFWFDGHTVSRGPWVIHAGANLVHLSAAAVWAGGVFAMTTIAWARRRATERTDLAAMVVRFSAPASVSLAAVIGAGLVMAVLILDSPGDLIDTRWGQTLLAKTAAVAVAAAMGAYNHFRLRPALEHRPDDPALARELRVSLSVESAVFVLIVVLTSWLVASAI